jgi:ribosomal protein S18 acetylase RimI-like enzyme
MGAFEDRELIGICGFLPFVTQKNIVLSDSGEIIQMYVKSAYRGKKIGLHLVEAVVEQAFRLPAIKQILLGVMEGNISAIRVYEQAGFETYKVVVGEVEVNHNGGRFMIIRRGG